MPHPYTIASGPWLQSAGSDAQLREEFHDAVKNSPALRVLVVDDEALIRWSLGEILTEAGHSVSEASSRESAICALTDRGPFDVVVLDYRLPDSNDLDLLGTIRRQAPTPAVVMMTAFGTPDVVNHALKLGAYRVVAKPFDMHEMADLVLRAHRAGLGGT